MLKKELEKIIKQLTLAEFANPNLEAELILSEILNISRIELQINPERKLDNETLTKIEEIVVRRLNNEPLQYIFEKAYFRDLELKVGEGVLIPRPETEILVDIAISNLPKNGTLCDIATGSGTIALSVAYERNDVTVIATDISKTALSYAKFNKEKYDLKNVEIIQSNLFSALNNETFDVITANLPYVTDDEYAELAKEVKHFEPKNALVAENEGMFLIEKTIKKADKYLKDNGFIILEMGCLQGKKTEIIFKQNGYSDIKIIKDYTGRDRFVSARNSKGRDRNKLGVCIILSFFFLL